MELLLITVAVVAVGWAVVSVLGGIGKQRCLHCGKWTDKAAVVCRYCGSEDDLAMVRERRAKGR